MIYLKFVLVGLSIFKNVNFCNTKLRKLFNHTIVNLLQLKDLISNLAYQH